MVVDGITPFQLIMFVVSWAIGFVVSRMSETTKSQAKKAIPLITLVLAGLTQAVQLFAQNLSVPAAPAAMTLAFTPLFHVTLTPHTSYMLASVAAVNVGFLGHLGGVAKFLLDTIAQWWLVTGGHSTTKNLKELAVGK